jgi:Na+/H+ antiporter NhaD/arsenite permease-like protein
MSTAILVVFALVYLGMVLGEIPGLALDRTGVALLGAIAMVVVGALPFHDAWAAVDMSTLLCSRDGALAQFRLAGFYSQWLAGWSRWSWRAGAAGGGPGRRRPASPRCSPRVGAWR